MGANRILFAAGLLLIVGVIGWMVYAGQQRVPMDGLMVPKITLEQQRARRANFVKWQTLLWAGDAVMQNCKRKDSVQQELQQITPLADAWGTRHYFYSVYLRYGHMPRVKTWKKFKSLAAADRKKVATETIKKMKQEGGCKGPFAQKLELLSMLSMEPRLMPRYAPEYQAEKADAFEKSYKVLFHLFTVRAVQQQCHSEYALTEAQSEQINTLFTRYYTDAFAKLKEAMPLDGDFVRNNFRQIMTGGTTLALTSINTMVADKGCQVPQLQQSYDFVKTLLTTDKK